MKIMSNRKNIREEQDNARNGFSNNTQIRLHKKRISLTMTFI